MDGKEIRERDGEERERERLCGDGGQVEEGKKEWIWEDMAMIQEEMPVRI